MQEFFIQPLGNYAKFTLFVLAIILLVKIVNAIIQKIIKMNTNPNYKKQYYKQLIKEAEHHHMKCKLDEAEQYRKEKWKDPYNP